MLKERNEKEKIASELREENKKNKAVARKKKMLEKLKKELEVVA